MIIEQNTKKFNLIAIRDYFLSESLTVIYSDKYDGLEILYDSFNIKLFTGLDILDNPRIVIVFVNKDTKSKHTLVLSQDDYLIERHENGKVVDEYYDYNAIVKDILLFKDRKCVESLL